MLSNVRGFSTGFHAASAEVAHKDSARTRVAAPSLKAADIGKHVRATCLLEATPALQYRKFLFF
jgi:hypothetical protein